jgi:putative hydrolase of the HAD superfamily
MPRAPRAILLDALGTLVDLEPPAPLLRVELAARFGVELSEADCERAIAAEIAYYRAHLGEGRDRESLAALRRRCAGVLRDALPARARDTTPDLGALTEALVASLRFRPYPDAEPALNDWRERGLRLVVVSNWDVSLHEVLDRAGLGRLLDGVITSAEAGARKPSPAIFERALRLAGVEAAEAIHAGDSQEEDICGARAVGIGAVLLRRSGAASAASFAPSLRYGLGDAPKLRPSMPGEASALVPGVRTIASLAELTVY